MEVGYLPTIPQQLHDNCFQISVKVVKLSSFEVSKNSGKSFARSTTLSEGERIESVATNRDSSKMSDMLLGAFCFIKTSQNESQWILDGSKDKN